MDIPHSSIIAVPLRKDRVIKMVIRYETEPRKQAQVDFGNFGYIGIDGVWKKLYAFSYILGYSRYRFGEFTVDISTQNLIKMHLYGSCEAGNGRYEIINYSKILCIPVHYVRCRFIWRQNSLRF